MLVLVFGIWVGGAPLGLAARAAARGAGRRRGHAVVEEAIDEVHASYYREIPKERLADDAIDGMVSKLDDRFSDYFDPAEYARFKQSQNSEFSGVGLAVDEHPARAARRGRLRRLAGRPRRHPQGRRDRRGGGPPAGRAPVAGGRVAHQGPAGQPVRLAWLRDGKRRAAVLTRATVTVPVVASELRRAGACKAGVVRLAQFSSGAHAEVYAALRRQSKRGAEAFVLDLRGNGGGLVSEAQLVASAFLEEGPIVTTRGRAVPTRTLRATGDPVVPRRPVVVLVDRGTASASEIVAGALQDRAARRSSARARSARASSRRSSSCPTAARSTSPPASTSRPTGATSAARASRRGRAWRPTCRPGTTPRPSATRGWRARWPSWATRAAGDEPGPARGGRGGQDEAPRVVLLEQRGRFLVGEPFFERGGRVTVERSRDAAPGRLALLAPSRGGGSGRARIARIIGRPDVARDVIEALMLDRGLRRSFPPGVERAAERGARRPAARGRRGATSAR